MNFYNFQALVLLKSSLHSKNTTSVSAIINDEVVESLKFADMLEEWVCLVCGDIKI
jgi:hypothetical protein